MYSGHANYGSSPTGTKNEFFQCAFFRASPEGRIGVGIYTGEGCHLGGVIGIPWSGSETGLGVHVAAMRSFFVMFAAVVAAVGVAAAGCVRGALTRIHFLNLQQSCTWLMFRKFDFVKSRLYLYILDESTVVSSNI